MNAAVITGPPGLSKQLVSEILKGGKRLQARCLTHIDRMMNLTDSERSMLEELMMIDYAPDELKTRVSSMFDLLKIQEATIDKQEARIKALESAD